MESNYKQLICDKNLAVILSTYNGEKYIQQQIESILSQTYNDFILYIRDDGSSDRTKEIIKNYSSEYPQRIVILNDDYGNIGVVKSFEELLRRIVAPYYAFADQDDYWKPYKLEKELALIKASDNDGDIPCLVYTDLIVVDSYMNVINRSFYKFSSISPERALSLGKLAIQNSVVGCTTLFNKALVDKAMPFPACCLMHDWWLALCANYYGKIIYYKHSMQCYRQHKSNTVGAKSIKMAIINWKKRKGNTFASIDQALELLKRKSRGNRDNTYLLRELSKRSVFGKKILLLRKGILKDGLLRNLFFFFLEKAK